MKRKVLSVVDHSRDAVGLMYVYPVVSRRAGGVSVGINLNPNRACNWRCVYCQVPGLTRGRAPQIDVPRLETELAGFLDDVIEGDYLARCVPEGARRIADIAISGDGEPTSAREFGAVIAAIARVKARYATLADIPVRLITNGSFMGQARVLAALDALREIGGEVWFKIDGGRAEDFARINDVTLTPAAVARNLRRCAARCPTWVQTCMFVFDGKAPEDVAIAAYVDLLVEAGVAGLQGVLLYGLARPSQQPEAPSLGALSATALEAIAGRIRAAGLTVKVSP